MPELAILLNPQGDRASLTCIQLPIWYYHFVVSSNSSDAGGEYSTGRPSSFTQGIADAIRQRMGEGETLRAICRDATVPAKSTVFRWLNTNAGFAEQYSLATQLRADAWADEIIEIADDASQDTIQNSDGLKPNSEMVQRAKLRVDARKWLMAKAAPKKYGDRTSMEVDLKRPYANMTSEELEAEFNALMARAAGPAVSKH